MFKRPSQLTNVASVALESTRMMLELGVGIFIGIGVAVEVAGENAWIALICAACVALNNRRSEVQVTIANVPSWLSLQPAWWRFVMEWTLFLAQVTLAAATTLGLAAYFAIYVSDPIWLVPIALMVLVGLTGVAMYQRCYSNQLKPSLKIAILAIAGLIFVGLLDWLTSSPLTIDLADPSAISPTLLPATALLSIAYPPLGIAPQRIGRQQHWRQIALQIALSIVLAGLLYTVITLIGLHAVGSTMASAVAAYGAPLAIIMQHLPLPGGIYLITLGATVVLSRSLMWWLSQLAERLPVLNQPARFSTETPADSSKSTSARLNLISVSLILIGLILIGNLTLLWSFSAAAFLTYFALIHLIVLRQFPVGLWASGFSGFGLISCLSLLFCLDWSVWLLSLALIALGVVWYGLAQGADLQN